MNFDPARCRGDILTVVLSAPTFHKAHTNCAHFRELVNRLKSIMHRLGQKLCEFLVVEDLQRTTGRNFTHGAGMEAVTVVAKARLNEDCGLGQTLGVNLSGHIIQM